MAAGQRVGEDLQSVSRQQHHQTDEENLSEDIMTLRLFFSPLNTDFFSTLFHFVQMLSTIPTLMLHTTSRDDVCVCV